MSIRQPLVVIKQVTDTGTSGTTAYPFFIPQDCDNIVIKVNTGATFTGTNPTCNVILQTSDDGGTTWYDCANVGTITAAVVAANALWASVPVSVAVARSGSIIGAAGASTLAGAQQSGLPLLSQYARFTVTYGGTQLANTGVTVKVMANSQSATA